MEESCVKVYDFDYGKISICRHFREKASPEDVIKKAVIKTYYEPIFLTGSIENAKIQTDSSMPLRQ